jgi:hypothetical protein
MQRQKCKEGNGFFMGKRGERNAYLQEVYIYLQEAYLQRVQVGRISAQKRFLGMHKNRRQMSF